MADRKGGNAEKGGKTLLGDAVFLAEFSDGLRGESCFAGLRGNNSFCRFVCFLGNGNSLFLFKGVNAFRQLTNGLLLCGKGFAGGFESGKNSEMSAPDSFHS